MNKNKYFADMFVHLHQHSQCAEKGKLEKELCKSNGVFSVHFDTDEHRDAMVVAYNPEVVSSDVILDVIKTCCEDAVSVAGSFVKVSDNSVTLNDK
jgi:hypothetical protein